MSRPNILFMIADDHRRDAIGAMGDPTVQTPTMDALAEDGTVFNNAYIMGGMSGAVCVPSRACVHTGVNIFGTSMTREPGTGGLGTLRPELATLAGTFRDAGYDTFATGKWHNDKTSFHKSFSHGANIFFGGMSNHLKVPIQQYDPTGEYANNRRAIGDGFSTELFSDAAIDFLENHEGGNPFFLYLSFTSPHDPRMAPAPYDAMYPPEEMPVPPNFMPMHSFDNGEMRIRDENLAPFPRTPEIVQQHISDYYAMITHQDAHMARVLEALERSGQAENTIVVYTADHGLGVGQHGLLGKQNLYDHSVCVPCILRGPDIPAGQRIDSLVYSYDLFPTLCNLTDIAIPDTVESSSLAPLVAGGKSAVRNSVYSAYRHIQRMVRAGDWKLIRYPEAGQTQLFNVKEDPWETRNLADEPPYAAVRRSLNHELHGWMQQIDDPIKELPALQ